MSRMTNFGLACVAVGLAYLGGHWSGSRKQSTESNHPAEQKPTAVISAIASLADAVDDGSPTPRNATSEEKLFEVLRKSDSLERLTDWTELVMDADKTTLRELNDAAQAGYKSG